VDELGSPVGRDYDSVIVHLGEGGGDVMYVRSTVQAVVMADSSYGTQHIEHST
jgi:hypothetical protein